MRPELIDDVLHERHKYARVKLCWPDGDGIFTPNQYDRENAIVSKKDFRQFVKDKLGGDCEYPPPYTPELNGAAEVHGKLGIRMLRAAMYGNCLKMKYWPYCCEHMEEVAEYLPNTTIKGWPSTYELLYGTKPSWKWLDKRIPPFGSPGGLAIPKQKRVQGKLSEIGVLIFFLKNNKRAPHACDVLVGDKIITVARNHCRFDYNPHHKSFLPGELRHMKEQGKQTLQIDPRRKAVSAESSVGYEELDKMILKTKTYRE